MNLFVRSKLFVRRQMVSLWGSRGLLFRVVGLAKSNALATVLYLMSYLAPIIVTASFHFGSDSLNHFDFSTLLLIPSLISILLLAVSLYCFSYPVSMGKFLRDFFAAFLTVNVFFFVAAMFILVLPDALNFYLNALRDVLLAAYTACLFARVALSESFNFKIPSKVFVGTLIMATGVRVVDLGIGHFMTSHAQQLLLAAAVGVLSVPVFLAAMIALRRQGLKECGASSAN